MSDASLEIPAGELAILGMPWVSKELLKRFSFTPLLEAKGFLQKLYRPKTEENIRHSYLFSLFALFSFNERFSTQG